jgi:hypothetical protein
MIEARADHSKVMPLAEKFYADVIASRKESPNQDLARLRVRERRE